MLFRSWAYEEVLFKHRNLRRNYSLLSEVAPYEETFLRTPYVLNQRARRSGNKFHPIPFRNLRRADDVQGAFTHAPFRTLDRLLRVFTIMFLLAKERARNGCVIHGDLLCSSVKSSMVEARPVAWCLFTIPHKLQETLQVGFLQSYNDGYPLHFLADGCALKLIKYPCWAGREMDSLITTDNHTWTV